MLQIQSPFQQLFDTNGSPLDDGYVYIGTANANPETSPIAIYWDDAGTIPAAQPLRTLNGYIVRSGTPARVYTALDDFSMTVKDRQGRVVFSVLDATADSNLTTALASSSGSSLVGFLQAGAGAQARTVQSKLREVVSAKDFGAVGDGVTDDTLAMQAAFNYVASVGGTLRFEPGTYLGRIDFSGTVRPMVFDGQGALFRPYTNTQTEVFYCKNSTTYPTISGNFAFLNVTFKNVQVWGRLTSASSDTDPTGHINYGVNFICTSAKWYDSSFQYAKIAAYYGYYHQYGEFYSCLFGAGVYSDSTAGCLLDGNTAAESSNENRFFSTKLFSNKNGLIIKGGIKNRIYATTIQDLRFGGSGGIWLTTDVSGFGADGTEIHGSYTEINNGVPAILVGVAPNTIINGLEFLASGEYIQSTHCYNLSLRDVNGYNGGSINLAHPAGNADTASLSVVGGNIKPSVSGLAHAGPTYISLDQPAIAKHQNDSVLLDSAQTGTASAPFIGMVDLFGVKSSVAKATTTNLFSLTQKTFTTLPARISVFTVELFLWDSNASTTQFGYSGHLQRYSVFITNNTTGAPQVYITQESAGTDIGISTAFQAPGTVTLSSAVVGDVITFRANWPGSGTGAASMSVQDIAYILRGAGTVGFYLTRL